MPNRKSFFSLLLLSLVSSFTFAQGVTISGIIKDNYNEPLFGAIVTLRNNVDSFVSGTATEMDGSFVLTDVQPGNYKLVFSFLGYEDYLKNITVANEPISLGMIKMSNKSTALGTVQIEGQAIAVRQKEDTTEYNAGSYKVNPDANAADLIRKMPGMDLSTGTPKAQGENITKVLVDGKPFFGDDAASSLNNLPAEVIDKIQVYDEKSEQSQFTGFDDGNTSKTVNIITKPDKRQGVFGQVHAGYGYDNKYDIGGNANYFEGNRRISLIELSNNVNIQNFGAQDLVGVGGGRRHGPRGNRNNNFMVNPQDGISKTNAIGLNYSDQWGKKIEVTGSYFFNNSNNTSDQQTHRDYVLPEQSGQSYDENSHAVTKNYNHRFNLRLNYTIDSNNSILFIPKLSLQTNNSQSQLSGRTLQDLSSVLNQTTNNYGNDASAYDFSGMLLFRHKFKKRGRTLSFWSNGGWNKNDGSSNLFAENLYEDATLNDTLDQQAVLNSNGWNINANLNYTEPLSLKSGLQVRYGLLYDKGSSDKRTYNFSPLTQDYTVPDSMLSNTFTTKYLTHKAGLAYRFSDSKLHLNVRMDYQHAELLNEGVLPYSYSNNKAFNNILPSAMLRYQFDKNKSLRLYYRTSTDNPSVTQLQDVVDNQNPLQLTSGNPDLNQAYEHSLRLRYGATNMDKSTTFFAMLSGNYTMDYIGQNTISATQDMLLGNGILLPKGAQFTRPLNMDGYWNVSSFATFGMPIAVLKSNLNLNAQAGFVRTPGMINGGRNLANNTNAGLGFTFSSNISEKVDFTLSSTGSYNWVKNTLNTASDNSFYNQNSMLSVNYIFWKGIVFHTDLNHQLYSGFSAGFNQNYLLWNMSIGKKLFRKQQGEIKVSVFDLLNQNNSIQRTITQLYSEDVQTNVLQRYFMLTFTYNLRFFKGGASMKDVENNKPPHPWH
jgi:hypothetical protein